jgi:hypothetical protein
MKKVLKDERKFPNLMKNFLKKYREVLESLQEKKSPNLLIESFLFF